MYLFLNTLLQISIRMHRLPYVTIYGNPHGKFGQVPLLTYGHLQQDNNLFEYVSLYLVI